MNSNQRAFSSVKGAPFCTGPFLNLIAAEGKKWVLLCSCTKTMAASFQRGEAFQELYLKLVSVVKYYKKVFLA